MDVIIGSPVKRKEKKNLYEVKLECMSGDADAYHTNGSSFSDKQQMIDYVTIALAISEAMSSGYARDIEEVVDELEKVLSPELFESVEDGDEISDMCGGDVTCDGQYLAAITGVEVFWYDENGTKFNCEIIV